MGLGNEIIRDGTNQLERFASSLDPNYVKIDGRNQDELLQFIHNLSTQIAFYDLNNQPNGVWRDLLSELLYYVEEKKTKLEELPSHIALIIVLVKLFHYAQNELNTISKKHLDFYYKKILGIKPKSAQEDKIQLVLQLAKKKDLSSFRLKSNTIFLGKGIDGLNLKYKTTQDAIISKAKIASINNLFVEKTSEGSRVFSRRIANSLGVIGLSLDESKPFWATFGETQTNRPPNEKTMEDASIGFAISSPILLLEEGYRTIDITIKFLENGSFSPITNLQNSFEIWYSGEEGWIKPFFSSSTLVLNGVIWELKFHIILEIEQPAFTFFSRNLGGIYFDTIWPLVKFYLKPEAFGYDTLTQLEVHQIDITVEAKDVKNLIVQNDLGEVDIGKPFYAFGPQPVLGSSLYIGSEEIFQKKLEYLKIGLQWHEVPDQKLAKWYEQYGVNEFFGNNSFESRIRLLLNKSWNNNLRVSLPLFKRNDASEFYEIEIEKSQFDLPVNYKQEPSRTGLENYNITTTRGFIQIDLTGPKQPFKAFGHKEYIGIYTQQAIKLAKFNASTDTGQEPILPNLPYTPVIKDLKLHYKSSHSITIKAQNEYNQLFQISPFGWSGGYRDSQPNLIPLIEEEGSMIIGLDEFAPPQTINILFEVEPGSGSQEINLEKEEITWSYLSSNQWKKLTPQELLSDSTQGFKKSGIVSLAVPKDATKNNQLLPSELIWLKAGVKENAEGAAKLKKVYTNAVDAVLIVENEEKINTHLSQSLPPNSVTKLATKESSIKKVFQPLVSNSGRPSELSQTYYTRISERLRHKKRAVQIWDYERLVLEAFPEIFKVKCVRTAEPNNNQAAGALTLIVVSNLRDKNTENPFQPGTSKVVLERIQTFIKQYTSPFIKIYVEQPIYESILVEAKIGFRQGFDVGYYSLELNTAIQQFLSPWAFKNGEDIVFGGIIYKSSILKFIESLPYVDYVINFKLYHVGGGLIGPGIGEMEVGLDFEIASTIRPGIGEMGIGGDFVVGADVPVACASTPKSILVSAENHRIESLRPNEFLCEGAASLGIGFMTINMDFSVGE